MRPLEIVATAANVLALGSLVLPRVPARAWVRGLTVPVALLLTVVQMLVEGARWQLAPVYASTTILFLIWLSGLTRSTALPVNRLLAGFGAGLGVLAIAFSVLLASVMPVFEFAEPTGRYSIGTTTYHWEDTSRPELLTADADDHRELMAQVWYPAEPRPAEPRTRYLPDSDAVIPALARRLGLPEAVLSQFGAVTTNAVENAPVASDQPDYPVLFVLGGLGSFRSAQTFQIQELASHGYIVVGLDQPGAAISVRFPDGRQFPGWTKERFAPYINQSWWPRAEAPRLHGTELPNGIYPYFGEDVSFALDQLAALDRTDPDGVLAGRLDLDRVGLSGISFGGAAGAQACADDRRLDACFIMDVQLTADVMEKGMHQPVMFMTRDAATFRLERETSGGWPNREIAGTIDTMTDMYHQLPGAGYYVQVPGLFHLDFTDASGWSPITRQLGMNGTIAPERAHEIINAYSLAFFEKHLKGTPSELLDGPSNRFDEARLAHRDGQRRSG